MQFPTDLSLFFSLPEIDYINDGVYGAFNCTLFDHQVVHPVVMTLGDRFLGPDAIDTAGPLEECSVWGESCNAPCRLYINR